MQRQHGQMLALGLLLLGFLSQLGCSSVEHVSQNFATEETEPESVRLSYQTDCDRLLVAGGSAIQPASYAEGESLPAFSRAVVEVVYPHPEGRPEYGQIKVTFAPDDGEAAFGVEASSSGESWVMDVPARQISVLVGQLRDEGFFRSSRILDAEAFLATEINGRQFSKPCHEISELDGVVVRIRQQGRRVGREATSGAGVAIERIPAIY